MIIFRCGRDCLLRLERGSRSGDFFKKKREVGGLNGKNILLAITVLFKNIVTLVLGLALTELKTFNFGLILYS